MTLENAEKISDKIIEEIKPFHVVITGGEPMLNKETTYNLMSRLHQRDIDYNINSNLTLFGKEDFEKIVQINPKTTILTSLPSHNEQTFKRITSKNNLSLFYNNLKMSLNAQLDVVPNRVIHKLNKNQVYAEGKYLYEHFGIKSFCATPVLKPANRQVSFCLDNNETIKSLEELIRLREDFKLNVSSLEVLPRCFLPKHLQEEKIFQRSCTAGRSSFMIGYEGTIRACGHSPFEEGNLLKQNFKDIWENLKEYRNGNYVPNECKDCLEVLSCRGGCRFEGFMEGDSRNKKDSRMGEIIRKPIDKKSLNISLSKKYSLGDFKIREESKNKYTIYNGNVLHINGNLKNFLEGINKQKYIQINELPKFYHQKAEALGKVLLNGGFLKEYDKKD